MKKRYMVFSILLILFTGCSALNREVNLENTKLVIGTSTTAELVEKVGLPNKIIKENKLGFWVYSGTAEKSSIYFPIPLGGSNINPIYLDINLIKDVPSDAIIIYVFNKNKILVKSFKPKKGKS